MLLVHGTWNYYRLSPWSRVSSTPFTTSLSPPGGLFASRFSSSIFWRRIFCTDLTCIGW
ncbi:unnamed protein product [Dibothriocephalus latus]|uniref:Uncharacterized protein n=1 Tax=Dibothriocephalus latus TaxID=60516 RepID=A0A3P7RJD6_DIBLA|nr:unnamed protein product [Dibothriocephalus latus]